MKKYLLMILIYLLHVTAYAEDSVQTRAGELRTTGELNAPKLTLNNKVLFQGNESFSYSFQDWEKFKFVMKDADVILVRDAVSAMCSSWFFLTIPLPPAKPTRTDSFGMICGEGGPTITQKDNVLTIKTIGDNGKRTTLLYENGKIIVKGKRR